MPRHSWEGRRGAWEHDAEAAIDWGGGSCSDSEDEVETEVTPGMEFVKMQLRLLFHSTLSAAAFCVTMWWAAKAGITEAEKYGLKPGSSSGHYHRKVKKILGWNCKDRFYELITPGHGKHDLERRPHVVPTIPGHEQLAQDIKDLDDNVEKLRSRLATDGGLPPSYYHHPVVQGARADELVWPIAIYLDGVPYSHTDGVIGWWMINLISGQRYCYAILRKRNLCQCGCRGWCTYWHFFAMTRWSMRSLAVGLYPDSRHDLTPWIESDTSRLAKAGSPTAVKCAMLYIKGDWMEFATTVGLPMWGDGTRPCFCCNGFGDDLYETGGNSMEALRWHVNEEHDYFHACDRCEKHVRLLRQRDVTSIVRNLRYDKRTKDSSAGRTLMQAIVVNTVHLKLGDRLEPSYTLPDVGALEEISTFPTTIVFWRRSVETLTRHRNPVFDPEIGITPARSLTVDVLHAFFLGIMNMWAKVTIWKLILSGCYGNYGTQDENALAATLVLRDLLMAFYKKHHEEHREDAITRVADLTVKMLGSANEKKLKTKGAETWGVALFLIYELPKRMSMLGGDGERLLQAGKQLEKIVRIWKANDWTMPRPAAQESAHAYPTSCYF